MLLFPLLAQVAVAAAIGRRSDALKVVDHVMPLKSLTGLLPKSRMLLQAGSGTAGHDIPLTNVDQGEVYVAPVQVGADTYEVVIDTGSSNPWLVEQGYTCFDPYSSTVKKYNCRFGKPYAPDGTLQHVPNRNFNISYDDGSALLGTLGYEKMTMAGFEVSKQEFGLVNRAGWSGDGTSSGLFGFAYRFLTMSYNGTNPDQDQADQVIRYNPLFTNMIANGVDPVFTLVVNQTINGTGTMALGGIPREYESLRYITTPVHQTVINNQTGRKVDEFYAVNPSHFVFSNKTDGSVIRHSVSEATTVSEEVIPDSTGDRPIYAVPTDYIVDSGTTLMYIANDTMTELAKQYDPPAYHDEYLNYYVHCDAKPPSFGVEFGNDVIEFASSVMIQGTGKTCFTGVQSNVTANYNILGGTFLKNVVAVFDVGNSQMHFAQRSAGH